MKAHEVRCPHCGNIFSTKADIDILNEVLKTGKLKQPKLVQCTRCHGSYTVAMGTNKNLLLD